jgi:hypothetical protein
MPMRTTLSPTRFLSVTDFDHATLVACLELAAALKAARAARRPHARPLAGRHVALLFEKPSLRTRSTFQIAVRELGGDVIEPLADVVLGGRETIADVARNLERWVHAVVIRTFAQSRLEAFADAAPRLRVVNALTNEEHPCQALADCQTMIERWGELQGAVRAHLVRSCSQHMAGDDAAEALEAPELEPIRVELHAVHRRLAAEREHHGGRKAYHAMVAAYFHDLARTWSAMRRVCRPGATAHVVVGDSAPYGVHVPVERWLGELALGAGFASWEFAKLRDRNTKWRNRKHRVPLHEGILTVRG